MPRYALCDVTNIPLLNTATKFEHDIVDDSHLGDTEEHTSDSTKTQRTKSIKLYKSQKQHAENTSKEQITKKFQFICQTTPKVKTLKYNNAFIKHKLSGNPQYTKDGQINLWLNTVSSDLSDPTLLADPTIDSIIDHKIDATNYDLESVSAKSGYTNNSNNYDEFSDSDQQSKRILKWVDCVILSRSILDLDQIGELEPTITTQKSVFRPIQF